MGKATFDLTQHKFPDRRFWNFYNTFFSSSAIKALKVKCLHHLWSNHRNFYSESSYCIYLQVIQPPGEPWEHHLGEVVKKVQV